MRSFSCLILSLFLASSFLGCAKKSMSERDVKREQLRLNAHKKRQEIAPLAGDFRGLMTSASGYKQDISLHLEVKDVPEIENGQIDPVLVPTLNGALNLTYGSGSGLELFSFATTKADFSSSNSVLDIVVSNTQFKEINLSLKRVNGQLKGTWSSPSASVSGDIELERTNELNLGGETPAIKGLYPGVFEWGQSDFYSRGLLTFSTGQDGVDSFHITASLKINQLETGANETFIYEFGAVEFNPFTQQLTLRSDNSDIYLVGTLNRGKIIGNWYSKRIGLLGTAQFAGADITAPVGKTPNPAASGTWFGKTVNTRSDAQLPERLLFSFNAVPDKSQPGGLALVGSMRLYYGPFSSNEYLEHRFETIDYQPFARKIVATTSGSPKLTFHIEMAATAISGRITDSSLGDVATFSASHDAPPTEEGSVSIAGEYIGFFAYDQLQAFQLARVHLVPSQDPLGLRFSAALSIYFGETSSGEALVYRFDQTDFNSVTGLLTLSDPASDIVIKAKISSGTIQGEWISTAIGRLGPVSLAKAEISPAPSAPLGYNKFMPIKGTYRGSLVNTSNDTNLPERIMFGLITSLDASSPRGLKVTGNLRLYYGPFESNEFIELPFETLQFDPFRRTIVGKTSGLRRLTVRGTLSNDNHISGTLSDDSLGEVGAFEVNKYAL